MSYGIAVISGGLDSSTLVAHLLNEDHTVDLVSFDYGQRHKKELQYAAMQARQLGLNHDIVDLTSLTHLISNSALTSSGEDIVINEHPEYSGWNQKARHHDIEVPDGHYAEETMKQTVVPNRNMIMLSIAAGIAVNRKANFIATGVHAGDHFIYPDCRPGFIHHASQAIGTGNVGFSNFSLDPTGTYYDPIYAPFISMSKADIAYRALELGVPLHHTWSCYKGGQRHCGRCGTCVERLEAIDEATRRWADNQTGDVVRAPKGQVLLRDQTEYDDTEYWRTAVREAKKNG